MSEPAWITSVPRNTSERLELLGTRPLAWEYLLFGAALLSGLDRTEDKWRDYRIGYVAAPGPALDDRQIVHEIKDLLSRGEFVASTLGRVISLEAQQAAFGPPGEPGDVELIEHLASRLIGLYEQMLDWHAELRALRVSDRAQAAVAAAHAMLSQPPHAVRDFVFGFVGRLEESLRRRAAGDETPIMITMDLTLSIDDTAVKQFRRAMRHLG